MRYSKICYAYRDTGKCKNKLCQFDHVNIDQGQRDVGANRTRVGHRPKTNEKPPINGDFSSWRRNIPQDIHNNQPLGFRLGRFFKEARRLVDMEDDSLTQEVVLCFAKEGGLKRIRENIERDFSIMASSTKQQVFMDEVLQFFEIITHPGVLASLILEQAVGTIYNFVFGQAGSRAILLFSYVANVFEEKVTSAQQQELTISNAETMRHLEVALLVLKQVIEMNSTAFVCEPLKPLVSRFETIFKTLHSADYANLNQGPRAHLEHIQRRLDIGSSLPALDELSKIVPKKELATFIVPAGSPGGRHDNDNSDICMIKIMPTLQEIRSSRAEYLPPMDPRQWHIPGVEGLLDRQFRLLREDKIGQLRDAIHSEIAPHSGTRNENQRNGLRTHVYRNVTITDVNLDKFLGFQIHVEFPQPQTLRGASAKAREEWWHTSKRLQAESLVFLTDHRDCAVFCTLVRTQNPPGSQDSSDQQNRQREGGSLWKDEKTASIVLGLVESDERTIRCILDCYNPGQLHVTLSLVEFPGVLLPSFQQTLLALQRMKKSVDLPFSNILVPANLDYQSAEVNVGPPKYATKPGFNFNLQCLMKDNSTIELWPNKPFDLERLQQHSTLDEAQAVALVNTLQRRIGLIQGPPGTGKSYTGVSLVKVLLANKVKAKLGPIICVCYTNHALDQFLEDLLQNEISSQIIRIGSQSKSELLMPLNLRTVAQKVGKTRLEKLQQWTLHQYLERTVQEFSGLNLDKQGSQENLRSFLKDHNPRHYQQFFAKDEDGFQRATGSGSFRRWLHGGKRLIDQPRSVDTLQYVHIDAMSNHERQILHQHWVKEIRNDKVSQIVSISLEHSHTKPEFDKIRDEINLRCLRNADVIGVTTSGLARNLNMLRRLPSKVVICEEAGEVLEAHLLTALLPSVEHAIFIGDHLQLRPPIENYELSRENHQGGDQFALDMSLFERLVQPVNGIGMNISYSKLETQRRMHPSIAQLVRHTLYPQLKDSPSVCDYPEITGIRRRLHWLDHRQPEGNSSASDAMATATSTSHWNEHEIAVTTALVNHLVSQGTYKNGDIAVLTPYLGQLQRLRRRLSDFYTISLGERDQDDLEKAGLESEEVLVTNSGVRTTLLQALVATIDNFQGEEAKVVVISLVRSNDQNRCGFLRTSNRINVLLSRAKHGMYIIGNSATSSHIPMWSDVIDILRHEGNIGTSLELQCPRHPDTPIKVTDADHFNQFSPEGGCNLRCVDRLPCGHACVQKCHSDVLHNAVYCMADCPRPREGCDHPCSKRCGDPCPPKCMITVHDQNRILPCGHSMLTLPCWQSQDLSRVMCTRIVKKRIPGCDHEVSTACHVDVADPMYRCKVPCRSNLPCGHSCKRLCYECTTRRNTEDLLIDHGVCQQKCGRNHTTCTHVCVTPCHGEEPCPPCTEICDVRCGHSQCNKKCYEPCVPCAKETCLSTCPHSSCSMPCAAPCDHVPCSKRCEKLLDCGHQCPSVCGELCPDQIFCQICGSDEIKTRDVDFILGQQYQEINLSENPCIFPRCGHFLTLESMDGHLDLGRHYVMNHDHPAAIASSSEPFSIQDIKRCATCRGSLRDIARYGRLVRRALLDESTKKFILYSNSEYVPIAQEVARLVSKLRDIEGEAGVQIFQGSRTISIDGSRDHQIRRLSTLLRKHNSSRWREILTLRDKLRVYHKTVSVEEQPFSLVHQMVENVRRRKRADATFEFDASVLQTKGAMMSTALFLRLDTALLADFLSLREKVKGLIDCKLHVDLHMNRDECERLITAAASSQRISLQVEGFIFLAQLYALERSQISEPALAEKYQENGIRAIEEARKLCETNPGQTSGLLQEIDAAEKMLNDGRFYTAVTNTERLAVIQAMAREFRGTGHWYYCQNGHPFTIGECGMPMERARCPECGGPVGGRNHETVDGVTRARDLDDALRGLRL